MGVGNMLIGTYEVKLDGKNRIYIPAHFKNQLYKELMVTFFDEDLIIVSERHNFKYEDVLLGLNKEQRTSLVMEHIFNNTYPIDLDNQGRLLITNKNVSVKTNIKEKAYIVGFGKIMKIYSEKAYLIEYKKRLEEIQRLEVGESLKRLH